MKMKTMKKAKAPSTKTLARKAKEAAMIAWAKQQHAQFRADLREMFARERREPGGPGGTGITTGVNQIPAPRVIPTEQEMKAVSEAARKYIDSLDTPQGKLGSPYAPENDAGQKLAVPEGRCPAPAKETRAGADGYGA